MIEYENLYRSNQQFIKDYKIKFEEALETGWFILGEELSSFESNFSNEHESIPFVGVASGTDAILLALMALNLPKGSEVIVSSYTYIATILPIVRCGLVPVLVDPDINTYNINTSLINEALSKNTKAILVTHMHGKMADMISINEIAKENDLFVLEDCAQSHFSSLNGKKAGTWGDFGCFSFYPTKNLGALGDGGGVLCKSLEHYEKIQVLRNNGSSKKYQNEYIGINSRLDEIQAVFLNIKLKSLDKIIAHKRMLASIYFNNLKEHYILPVIDSKHFDSFHIFSIRVRNRDALREYLLSRGIKTEVHYPIAPHQQNALSDVSCKVSSVEVSEIIHDEILSLPVSYGTTVDEVEKVCEVLLDYRNILDKQ